MRYMADPIFQTAEEYRSSLGPVSRIPDRNLMPQPIVSDLMARGRVYRVVLVAADEWTMWKLIRENVVQFVVEFSDSLFLVFGVHWNDARTLLMDKYGTDLETNDLLACNGSAPLT